MKENKSPEREWRREALEAIGAMVEAASGIRWHEMDPVEVWGWVAKFSIDLQKLPNEAGRTLEEGRAAWSALLAEDAGFFARAEEGSPSGGRVGGRDEA